MTDKGDGSLLPQQVWNWFSRPQLWLFLLIVVAVAVMGYLSMARYWSYHAGMFDLGIMSQAIWSGSQGQALVFTAHGVPVSRLARHVELFYFVPALLYRFLPRPEILLLFQALLYAAGAWPVYTLSRRRLGSGWLALGFALIYLFYPVGQTAVLWDFHGDTLAMPFLAFALEALDRRAWSSYGLWLMLSLSCKVYVAAPVAALGAVSWWKGERRAGLWTALLAAAWGAIAFLGIRSVFAPPEAARVAATPASYVGRYFGGLGELPSSAGIRLLNAFIVFGPALWLGWRAPLWLLPACAVALPALLSDAPGPAFVYWYHHYALAVPFLLAASIYGAETLQERGSLGRPWWVTGAVIIALLFNTQFVDAPLNPRFHTPGSPLGTSLGSASSAYEITSRDRFKDEWLGRYVPAGAAVAANTLLAAHIANRDVLYLTRGQNEVRKLADFHQELDLIVTDALMDYAQEGAVLYEWEPVRFLMQLGGWGLMRSDDGLLLFQPGADGLTQSVRATGGDLDVGLRARFDDLIGLIGADVEALGNRRYRLTCEWVVLSPRVRDATYVAVSEPVGLEHARIVHLPTYALLPTPDWPVDSVIRESFEFTLPQDAPAGEYPLMVGWYNANSAYAAETDERSRLGETVQIDSVKLTE